MVNRVVFDGDEVVHREPLGLGLGLNPDIRKPGFRGSAEEHLWIARLALDRWFKNEIWRRRKARGSARKGAPCLRYKAALEMVCPGLDCPSWECSTHAVQALSALIAAGVYARRGDWVIQPWADD